MTWARTAAFAALMLGAGSSGAQSLALKDLGHARALGMAGAYRAHGLGTDAVFGNPAAIGLYKQYFVDVTGAWDAASREGMVGAAVSDSSTSELAAGAAYHYVSRGRAAGRYGTHLGTLALGVPLSQSFFLGASGHYISEEGATPNRAFFGDAALLVRLSDPLTASLQVNNVFDAQVTGLRRNYALSFAYLEKLLTVAVDTRARFDAAGNAAVAVSGGVEYVLGEGIPLRAGYSYDGIDGGQFLGVGVGVFSQGGGVDLAYRHALTGQGNLLALTVKFQLK